MRKTCTLLSCLCLTVAVAQVGAPALASDLESPRRAYPEGRPQADHVPIERKVAEFCYRQRQICSKICTLRSRFEDRFDGCPSSCESREIRCISSACYRWSESEFLIAQRFGGFHCAL
jgi:hypothetical protein